MSTSIRRLISAFAVLVTALTTLVVLQLPARAAMVSDVNGWITRSEVIERAQYWVDHKPGTYSQSGYSPGPTGDRNYRRDCSGYVDMAWHTGTDYSTRTLGLISHTIGWSQLKAGDILLDEQEHVILFDAWESDRTHFSYYTFGDTPVQRITHASKDAPDLDGHPRGDYVPKRYDKIVDDEAAVGRKQIGNDADGALNYVESNGSGGFRVRYQNAPNSTWHEWTDLGGSGLTGTPVLGRNADGTQEVFARRADGHVLAAHQVAPNSTWSGFVDLGGNVVSDPAVASNADGTQQIFARNAGGGISTTWQLRPNGTWHEWADLGGVNLVGTPTAVLCANGNLELFVRNGSGAVMNVHQVAPNSTWSGWSDLGGQTVGDPVVGSDADGRFELFGRTADGGTVHAYQRSLASAFTAFATV